MCSFTGRSSRGGRCVRRSVNGISPTAPPSVAPTIVRRGRAGVQRRVPLRAVKVLSVVGNRPQFVKSAPLSLALRERGIDEVVLHTGQHWDREMSQVFFDELALDEPRYRLDLHTRDVEAMRGPIRDA